MTAPVDLEAIAARWADYPASQAKRDIDALLSAATAAGEITGEAVQ